MSSRVAQFCRESAGSLRGDLAAFDIHQQVVPLRPIDHKIERLQFSPLEEGLLGFIDSDIRQAFRRR